MKKYKFFLFIITILIILASYLSASPLIKEGDLLKIYIIDKNGVDLLAGTYSGNGVTNIDPHDVLVSVDGRIYLPHIGAFNVANKEPQQIERLITTRLKWVMSLKEVAVLIGSPKMNRIYVMGEVNQPGLYRIDRTKPFEMKLINIISQAGGFTDRANQEEIVVESINSQRTTVNLLDMTNNKSTMGNISIKDQDTILVTQSLSRVYVIGEVVRPGGFSFISGASFADYIAEAGGMSNSASPGNIGIVRKNVGGKNIVYNVSLGGDFVSNAQKNISILPGDIIYIPRSFFADWKDIGSVLGIARDSIYIYDTLK